MKIIDLKDNQTATFPRKDTFLMGDQLFIRMNAQISRKGIRITRKGNELFTNRQAFFENYVEEKFNKEDGFLLVNWS